MVHSFCRKTEEQIFGHLFQNARTHIHTYVHAINLILIKRARARAGTKSLDMKVAKRNRGK